MEDVAKHSTFDLALVLSQPPLSVLTPPFKLEVSFGCQFCAGQYL